MKCTVGLFLLASAVAPVAAAMSPADDPATVNVLVTDRRGNPLRSAQVMVNGSGHKGVTNSSGRVVFTNMEPGEYTLRVERDQYITFEKDFAVVEQTGAIPVVAAISPLASLPVRTAKATSARRPAVVRTSSR